MKKPENIPDFHTTFFKALDAKKISYDILVSNNKLDDYKGRYSHWEKIKYYTPPESLTSEEWWAGIKFLRKAISKNLPFLDKDSYPFTFATPDCVNSLLHKIDQSAAGSISTQSPITNPHTKQFYLVNSIVNEAIHSSLLEGAATTIPVAKDMILKKRKPKDEHERMILNNYNAMRFIQTKTNVELTANLILELHSIICDGTLDDNSFAGKFRIEDVSVVENFNQEVLHYAPDASELEQRIIALCQFANSDDPDVFIHPVIKAILLHFMLAYDHPFLDGNGRTARALFYWYMVKQGYWMMEFISISGIIYEAPVKYGEAFLFTESDENDTTYFIMHQLNVITKAIKRLSEYLEEKMRGIESAEALLSNINLKNKLNFRQLYIIRHALKHPNEVYEFKAHQSLHNISYQTARNDLLVMSDELKLLTKVKAGKSFVFLAPSNLSERLEK